MTNFMLLLILWCLSKPFFVVVFIFMAIRFIIVNIKWY